MAWWQKGGGEVMESGREESLGEKGWEGEREGEESRRARGVKGEWRERGGRALVRNSPVRSHIFQVSKVGVEDRSIRLMEILYHGPIPDFIFTELTGTGHVWEGDTCFTEQEYKIYCEGVATYQL